MLRTSWLSKFWAVLSAEAEIAVADAGADRAAAHAVKLDYLQVTTGMGVKSVSCIGLDIAGEKFEASASGNGPVDAAISALKNIIKRQMVLKEFTIQAICITVLEPIPIS